MRWFEAVTQMRTGNLKSRYLLHLQRCIEHIHASSAAFAPNQKQGSQILAEPCLNAGRWWLGFVLNSVTCEDAGDGGCVTTQHIPLFWGRPYCKATR